MLFLNATAGLAGALATLLLFLVLLALPERIATGRWLDYPPYPFRSFADYAAWRKHTWR